MRRAKFLTLDDYIYFLKNPEEEDQDLTIDQLNQILPLHGFCKVHRQPKKVIIDALRSIPMLMTAFRSSIKQEMRNNHNISSCCSPAAAAAALLTKNEVIKDLSDLQWQEYCSLQSIETITPPTNNNNNNNNIGGGGGDKEKEKEKEKEDLHLRRRRRRRRRRSDDIIRGGNKLVMLSSKDDANWGAKRKRSSININNNRRRSSTWV